MKLEFDAYPALPAAAPSTLVRVTGETLPLTDVALCAPRHLSAVPCCSVTKEHVRDGFAVDRARALSQHRALRTALTQHGVRCHALPPAPDHADMCFTRDVATATPWGLVALNPALEHRAPEVERVEQWIRAAVGGPVRRIRAGRIEGGDVCVARPGLLVVGISGVRTDAAGADEFCAPFEADGWDVLRYRFDEHFLHLDTIFCMLDARRALACLDVLDDGFVAELAARGIELLPVTYKEARRLGCNVLSLDGRTILSAAGTPRVAEMMRGHGFAVQELELDELTACGGGVHCLTMPLRRSAERAPAG